MSRKTSMDKLDTLILLAEDEPNLQFLFARQLKHLGYEIAEVAGNGLIALGKVQTRPFDLIFMDVNMPHMDGLEATKKIREFETANGRKSPIVGLTAFDYEDKCLHSGMNDFLRKPVLLKQLDETLKKWCHQT